jgi:hypothetical protein
MHEPSANTRSSFRGGRPALSLLALVLLRRPAQ